jgi:hypothetical protein
LLLGGVLADRANDLAQLLGAWGALGALLGSAHAAVVGRPMKQTAAIWGGFGILAAGVIAAADAVVAVF